MFKNSFFHNVLRKRFCSSSFKINFTIKDLLNNTNLNDLNVETHGHIKSIRKFKNITFIDISDGTSFKNLSVVLKNHDDSFKNLKLSVGQSIHVKGTLSESKGKQNYDLVVNSKQKDHSLKIIGDVENSYPIQKKYQSYLFLRSHPTLRHRTSTLASVLRVRSLLEKNFFNFFENKNFIKVTPPIITGSDCEGSNQQFKVVLNNNDTYFANPSYLTGSTQLHLEVLAHSLNRVWSLSPCFRAEKSNTNRHLSEFSMLEAELCNIQNLHLLTHFVESMLKSVVSSLIRPSQFSFDDSPFNDLLMSRHLQSERESLKKRWLMFTHSKKWPIISYTDALKILNSNFLEILDLPLLKWGDSLSSLHEKWLSSTFYASPLFVTHYPFSQKPFYMSQLPHHPSAICFDLLFPHIGELCGGSIREPNYNVLLKNLSDKNISPKGIEWYLSTRKNGCLNNAGFGLGIERLLLFLTAIPNVKDISAFPRSYNLCPC